MSLHRWKMPIVILRLYFSQISPSSIRCIFCGVQLLEPWDWEPSRERERWLPSPQASDGKVTGLECMWTMKHVLGKMVGRSEGWWWQGWQLWGHVVPFMEEWKARPADFPRATWASELSPVRRGGHANYPQGGSWWLPEITGTYQGRHTHMQIFIWNQFRMCIKDENLNYSQTWMEIWWSPLGKENSCPDEFLSKYTWPLLHHLIVWANPLSAIEYWQGLLIFLKALNSNVYVSVCLQLAWCIYSQ